MSLFDTLLERLNLRGRRISLSSSPFFASAAVIVSLGVFMAIFWAFNEYEAYSESIANIQQSYKDRYRNRVAEEVGKVIGFIEYRRSQAEQQIESEIRDRVQAAYSIASHMYSRHKDEMGREELKDLVVEVLRPIRWSSGRGYYFAGGVDSGTIDLYGDDPFYEGKNRFSPELAELGRKMADITAIVKDKGAGIYRYNWTKPGMTGRIYPKITFVKYFKPFDWYIGAGIYIDDVENALQANVLERIRNIDFGRDGEIFGFRYDGTIICHRDRSLIGRSIVDFGGGEDSYGRRMWLTGLNGNGEGVVSYSESDGEGDQRDVDKLGYVKSYEDWDWIFVASMSMDEMEKAIENERKTYIRINTKNIALFISLFIVAVSLMLLFAYFYSMRIRQGISLFTNFLRRAVDEKNRIEDTHLAFSEFEDLRYLANKMVDDLAEKEQLIRRDELRLDTLLQLGMMEERCFQDKYDFILERIVAISRSEGGYLALVNSAQSHINLYCRHEAAAMPTSPQSDVAGISRSLDKAGLAGSAVLKGEAIICNVGGELDIDGFPYARPVQRHLDVPIVNSGKVVLVAGVYNKGSDYDNSDVRQITMLLEGLWLHVLKMCAEEEMARLERQIIAVSEEERSTIGRDLHDDLGSHLSGVELLCMVLQKKLGGESAERAEELGAIRNLIREAIEITRRLAQGLYPVHVVEHGLESSFGELKVEIENLFDLQCNMIIDMDREKIDASASIHLYYITREAVFNAARHGRPQRIEIHLLIDRNSLRLEINDDGCGFDEEKIQLGIGLHTMKYRAKAINASLAVTSEVGRGSRILLEGEI